MAIGKSGIQFNTDKLLIKFGDINIIQNGKINSNYKEHEVSEYMKMIILILKLIFLLIKKFTVYTMDLTKKYIEINADYRS